MNYLSEHYTKEEIIERFTHPTFEINDILDFIVLLNIHNFCPDKKINVYKDHLEVYGLGGTEKLEEYPYFDDNYFKIYLPVIVGKKSVLRIDMCDYREPIDVKERKQVVRHLKAVLPHIIEIDKIEFALG